MILHNLVVQAGMKTGNSTAKSGHEEAYGLVLTRARTEC